MHGLGALPPKRCSAGHPLYPQKSGCPHRFRSRHSISELLHSAFCRLLKPLPRYGSLFDFQDGGRPPSCTFKKLEILTAYALRRAKVRHHTQFCADRSNGCGDMSVFLFFKMAAVRHLGFVVRLFRPPTNCTVVVSVTVQNLVWIGAVVSIICKFWYFER